MRILLVEDEPSAARFIAKGLREASYAVDVARDGSAAAELCVENDYDAVVLDVMLPKKDGVDALPRAAGQRLRCPDSDADRPRCGGIARRGA